MRAATTHTAWLIDAVVPSTVWTNEPEKMRDHDPPGVTVQLVRPDPLVAPLTTSCCETHARQHVAALHVLPGMHKAVKLRRWLNCGMQDIWFVQVPQCPWKRFEANVSLIWCRNGDMIKKLKWFTERGPVHVPFVQAKTKRPYRAGDILVATTRRNPSTTAAGAHILICRCVFVITCNPVGCNVRGWVVGWVRLGRARASHVHFCLAPESSCNGMQKPVSPLPMQKRRQQLAAVQFIPTVQGRDASNSSTPVSLQDVTWLPHAELGIAYSHDAELIGE
jgi:hypothetical protein